MTVTEDRRAGHPLGVDQAEPPATSARATVNQMVEAGLLDDVMKRVDGGGLTLTGEGGFLPEMIRAVLERGLAIELTEHLGYEKGDPAGRGSPNSRNGTTGKTVATEVGVSDEAIKKGLADFKGVGRRLSRKVDSSTASSWLSQGTKTNVVSVRS